MAKCPNTRTGTHYYTEVRRERRGKWIYTFLQCTACGDQQLDIRPA